MEISSKVSEKQEKADKLSLIGSHLDEEDRRGEGADNGTLVERGGGDAVGNPHRAQIYQFEFFEFFFLKHIIQIRAH